MPAESAVRPPEYQSMLHVFLDRVRQAPERPAAQYKRDGAYETLSWQALADRARAVSLGLIALGLEPGRHACILSSTRVEWVIADLGVLGAGGVTVPIYPSNPADDCAYILKDCAAVLVFVENAAQLAKVRQVRDRLPALEHVILVEGEAPDAISWAALIEMGGARADAGVIHEQRVAALRPEQPLTIIYTSGTTGAPKGAVLSHANMIYEAQGAYDINLIVPDDVQLLFLPLAHVFAKLLECAWWRTGHVMAFAENVDKVVQNMGEVRPTLMAAVPRVYEKMYARVAQQAAESGTGALFRWAASLSARVGELERAGKRPTGFLALEWAVARQLVFGKISRRLNALFGGRMRIFVSGGAPLSTKIGFFLKHAGVLVLEGFGMTETSAATTINLPARNKVGTVGPVFPGTEIRIAADGEILVKGPGVMLGYFNDAAATREAIVDGWLHTGDIGEIDADGHLKITDRKKDLLITAGGKNVAPQNIENAFKTEPLISQIVVLGDRKKYLSALVTLNVDAARAFAEAHALEVATAAELAAHPKIREAVEHAIARYNTQTASYQTIKRFAILERDFSQDAGEITPTLKVKRKVVAEKYRAVIDSLYDESY